MVTFACHTEDRWKQYVPKVKEPNADQEYRDLTQQIVKLTGHEVINPEGALIPREQREENYRDAIVLLNKRLKLGMDEKDIEIMTLVYTALSEVPRFGGDIHMDPIKGENTGTHSIHTPIRAHKLIRKALEKLQLPESRESVVMRQLTCLCLVPHDIGEAIGEPGSLAQEVDHAHVKFSKNKPEAEKLVLNAIMRMAAHAVERKEAHDDDAYQKYFYAHLDRIKMPDISKHALVSSNEEFLTTVRDRLGIPPEITMDSEGRISTFSAFWNMIEEKDYVPNRFQGDTTINGKFIGWLASLSEHIQGTAHFIKFLQKEDDPTQKLFPAKLMQSARIVANMKYTEGELGMLFANAHTDFEKALAIEAKKEVYRKCIDFLSHGPAAIDRNATNISEYKPNHPKRPEEIKTLVDKSAEEGALQKQAGNEQAIRNIETKERLIAMYEWAREQDNFIPAAGQILITSPPEPFRAQGESSEFVKGLGTNITAIGNTLRRLN